MPGDYTRRTFNPRENHSGVFMQQGRVMLDADWNEEVEILDRRLRAGTLDIVGPCAVPDTTPDAFLVEVTGGVVTLGVGRMYVDGLLAENHGDPPLAFEPRLAEEKGTEPVPYDAQPYPPPPDPFPGTGGPYLVYLDVWQRELTWLEEPDLMEKAVGVDTATRWQTVWHVRTLEVGDGIHCRTPDGDVPGWEDLIRPSGGRLSSAAVGVPQDDDPCTVDPAGGFRGTENRLYRVEIHEGGNLANATFKWSRDNASVAAAVTAVNPGRDVLTVSRTGRDEVLRFSPEDWVEVTDDHHEFDGRPGEMRKVLSVDDVAQTITLASALTLNEFDAADPASRFTRIRRWDQQGAVLDAANAVVADVDTEGGVIPTDAGGGTMVLEDGVEVTFSLDAAGGEFKTGDFWLIAARTVDASVEVLSEAPPVGIHHHYCRLAVLTWQADGSAEIEDCRPRWPPHCTCCCTVTVGDGVVSHGDYDDLALAVRQAPAAIDPATPIVFCLMPGRHRLNETVVIDRDNVTVRGCDRLAPVEGPNRGPAFDVRADSVVLEHLRVEARGPATLIRVAGDDFELAASELSQPRAPALRAEGAGLRIVDNRFEISRLGGIAAGGVGLLVARNRLIGDERELADAESGAIDILPGTSRATIADNEILSCPGHGIILGGWTPLTLNPAAGLTVFSVAMSRILITRNLIERCGGSGITSRVVLSEPVALTGAADVIQVPTPIDGLRIADNRIADNVLWGRSLDRLSEDAPFGGIVLGHVSHVVVADNVITGNGAEQFVPIGQAVPAAAPIIGIYVLDCRGLVIADNIVTGNGLIADEHRDGRQGGIIGLDLAVRLENDIVSGSNFWHTDGWPAAAIQDNRVEAPLGHALRLEGVGAMPIHDNSLTATDLSGTPAVQVNNNGLPQLLGGFLLLVRDAPDIDFAELSRELAELEEFQLGGEVSFTDNRVRYRQQRESFLLAAVTVLGLDQVLFNDNQVTCSQPVGSSDHFLLIGSLLFGFRVMGCNNSLTETLGRALFSLFGFGLTMATATSNQATHCIAAEQFPWGSEILAHNQQLCCPFEDFRLLRIDPRPFPCPPFLPQQPGTPGTPIDDFTIDAGLFDNDFRVDRDTPLNSDVLIRGDTGSDT